MYLRVKYKLCDCGSLSQYVVSGYNHPILKEEVIGYDCNCKQIPIDPEVVRNTPKEIPSY